MKEDMNTNVFVNLPAKDLRRAEKSTATPRITGGCTARALKIGTATFGNFFGWTRAKHRH